MRRCVVLRIEEPDTLVKREDELQRPTPVGTRALDVDDLGLRPVEDLPASFPEATAPVEIFTIEPEPLVHSTDVLYCLPTDEHEGAIDRIDEARFVGPQAACRVARKTWTSREEAVHAHEVVEGRGDRREASLARVVERAVRTYELAA